MEQAYTIKTGYIKVTYDTETNVYVPVNTAWTVPSTASSDTYTYTVNGQEKLVNKGESILASDMTADLVLTGAEATSVFYVNDVPQTMPAGNYWIDAALTGDGTGVIMSSTKAPSTPANYVTYETIRTSGVDVSTNKYIYTGYVKGVVDDAEEIVKYGTSYPTTAPTDGTTYTYTLGDGTEQYKLNREKFVANDDFTMTTGLVRVIVDDAEQGYIEHDESNFQLGNYMGLGSIENFIYNNKIGNESSWVLVDDPSNAVDFSSESCEKDLEIKTNVDAKETSEIGINSWITDGTGAYPASGMAFAGKDTVSEALQKFGIAAADITAQDTMLFAFTRTTASAPVTLEIFKGTTADPSGKIYTEVSTGTRVGNSAFYICLNPSPATVGWDAPNAGSGYLKNNDIVPGVYFYQISEIGRASCRERVSASV